MIVIEMKAYTPPLSVHLDARVAGFRRRHRDTGMEEVITKAYRKIRWQLDYRQPQGSLTSGEKQTRWAKQWFISPRSTSELSPQQAVKHWWKKKWNRRSYQWGLLGVQAPGGKMLKIHKDLRKAESAILTQVRTG